MSPPKPDTDTLLDATEDAQDMITQRNYQVSALLRLPAELRNKIYFLAFGPHEIFIDKIECSNEARFYELEPGDFSVDDSLQFMSACRQIYAETKVLYWRTRTFRLGPPDMVSKATSIRNWLKTLRIEQRSAISHIAVHKDDFKLDALWEQLPELRGLNKMVLWGSYFMWGSDRVLAGILEEINDRIDQLVGHHIEVELEKEE